MIVPSPSDQPDSARRPSVLFVCARNGGKSPMAAALLRHLAGDEFAVDSAGTEPGTSINQTSVAALAEVGADMAGHRPKPITPQLIRGADRVIVLGREAVVIPVDGIPVEIWETDEPSLRGIDGIERMRLIRDDIGSRVAQLIQELRHSEK